MSAASPQRVLLQYTTPDGKTGMVSIDASVSETHTASAQVTDHPVETGPNVTDHIRVLPKRLSLSCLITNTPTYTPSTQMRSATGSVGSFSSQVQSNGGGPTTTVNWSALKFSDEFDRVRDAYGELVDAVAAGATFGITTTLANYDNMAATSFSVPRSVATGNALQFQIEFTELRIVETTEVAALPSQKKKPQSRGSKPPREASEKEKSDNRTALKRIAVSLSSAFGGGQ